MGTRKTRPSPAGGAGLSSRVEALRVAIRAEEDRQRRRIDAALPRHRASARNLAHYLGLRHQELGELQRDLAAVGLSSLGHCEGHVHDTVARILEWLSGRDGAAGTSPRGCLDAAAAGDQLHANTRALFGDQPPDRHVYIMVTAPDADEAGPGWADDVLRAGADVLRINGAHGTPEEWRSTIGLFRDRARACNRSGRVFVDLPGPKLRGEIRQVTQGVLHVPRSRDRLGRTVVPARILLGTSHDHGRRLPVPPAWLPAMAPGDLIEFRDAGGRQRTLRVTQRTDDGLVAESSRSVFVTEGLPMVWRRSGSVLGWGEAGAIPALARELRLASGDTLLINVDGTCADPAQNVLALDAEAVISQVAEGERVLLDDGRIEAVVEARRADGLLCRIRRTGKAVARLRTGKGIAFPDSHLSTPHLPEQDEAALAFALVHADGVGVSFVNTPGDVALVGRRIKAAGRRDFGMILKFETHGAMRNLPAILFEALRHETVGIMIARGDLAVEMSFERLAEMQEELLWFGEACHLPVIWATQVLDSMAHSGLATRAEVTDAAMSMRAECVMLNKGPHIAAATGMLSSIIRKMERHFYKKRTLHRPPALDAD